jgi:hypothetical protein
LKTITLLLTGLTLALVGDGADGASPPPGSWNAHAYWHEHNGSGFDYDNWTVEIDSTVPRLLNCTVTWSGVGIVRNYPGDVGHIGPLTAHFGVLVPAYSGRGGPIVSKSPLRELVQGNFHQSTTCH